MEKEALLKEAGQTAGNNNNAGAYSTLNTSKGAYGYGGGSLDIGSMSLKDLRREDLAVIEDLNDQVKTKEEEI